MNLQGTIDWTGIDAHLSASPNDDALGGEVDFLLLLQLYISALVGR